ncbi:MULTISPECIES: hypothetical protein [Streptomyces]|uniref:hypothetical protein n=1 Tax=Streptomyces TaxID=1883 RepID=UPI0023DD47B0|nr:hypothetical protein [Streptomyces sp. FXJ1.172]WEP00777.1 hypothetical protein A6P39_042145 [Streptomyces sp. FXJ1.172]
MNAPMPRREPGAALRAIEDQAPPPEDGVNLFGVTDGETRAFDRFRLTGLVMVQGGMNDPEPAA